MEKDQKILAKKLKKVTESLGLNQANTFFWEKLSFKPKWKKIKKNVESTNFFEYFFDFSPI